MEEEEHSLSDREQKFAMLQQTLNKMRRNFNEGTLDGDMSRDGVPAEINGNLSGSVQNHEKITHLTDCHDQDNTDHINQIIGSNSPETCLSYLTDMERGGDVHLDGVHLTKLLDFYTRVFSRLPLRKYCHNESYAKMLVRFAELKALQDVAEAETNFNVARSHSQRFAFVHVAHAQFEHSHGNTKKGISILQVALERNAKPRELLEVALQSLQSGNAQPSCSEDKENVSVLGHCAGQASAKNCPEFKKVCRISDGTDDLQLSSVSWTGRDSLNGSSDDQLPGWRSSSQRRRVVGLPGRVPLVPILIPESDGDSGDVVSAKRSDAVVPGSLSRQTSGSSASFMSSLSSAKNNVADGDFLHLKPPTVSPEMRPWEELSSMVDSTTTTLLYRRDKRMEDTSCNFKQILSSNSPESCRSYLLSLEKRGDPHSDHSLFTKLRDYYKKVLGRLHIGRYSSNQSYARMLVRYAELIGMEDADDARDQFTAARCYCKGFAFVHIAYAQFEVSQGNVNKASSILHKAQSLRASPAEQLKEAIRNLNAGQKRLLPPEEAESPPETQSHGPPSVAACVGNQDFQIPVRVPVNLPVETPKPVSKEPSSAWKEPSSAWKGPSLLSLRVSPEEKHVTPPPDSMAAPRPMESQPTPSLPVLPRPNLPAVYQTPKNYKDPHANSFVTPVVKRDPDVAPSAARRPVPTQQPCTPVNQLAYAPTPQAFCQASNAAFSANESISINGKQFFILKMIGRGGSSKVYQVLDHKKQLFAVKYVNLKEADAQTVESYKNEIEHLNHLQQYSDQIIKLFDYEISNSHIYMLMECGNLDLNTWLRSRKAGVNSLERKFYWKNMLDAVHTIHKHGIVHSDLKPANFVIVNATLKLIDFGISNRIQPDVTSIMKDSQVGTLNYMPPEAIKDTSSKPGKAGSKISPKGDVWSLGCILYCMTYGKTPFQSITNQFTKLQAIIDPSHQIEFPDVAEKDLLNVLMRCLVRDPRKRISIAELLDHPYLQLQPQKSPETEYPDNSDLRRILTDLAALQSPSSIVRAASNLAKMCNSGRKLDVAECAKSSQPAWKM